MGDDFRDGRALHLYGTPVEGESVRERALAMDRIAREMYEDREVTTEQQSTESIFSYGFGRASAAEASFSLMTRKVHLSRSVEQGRWQFEGNAGKCFPKPTNAARSVTQVMGSFQIGWAVATERDIVHFRAQTVRSGYAARIAESAIILDSRGPEFQMTLSIPTTASFPENEIMVFQGRGWTMDPDMLDEFNLDVLRGNEEVYFWADKCADDEDCDDSGLLNYKRRQLALSDRPTALVRESSDGQTVAAVVSSNRRRRRINPRRGV